MRPVLNTALRDHRLDALGPEQTAVLVEVIAAVGQHPLVRWRGRPGLPPTGPTPSIKGSSWVTSLRCPPVSVIARGTPPASVIRWCLEPLRARSTGEGPVKPPLKSADMAAVHHRCRPIDSSDAVEAAQQLLMQLGEHTGPLPLDQPPVRDRGRAAQLARQMPPGDTGEQHEHNRAEADAIIDTRPAASRIRPVLGQQRRDHVPQVVPRLPHRLRHPHPIAGYVSWHSSSPPRATVLPRRF